MVSVKFRVRSVKTGKKRDRRDGYYNPQFHYNKIAFDEIIDWYIQLKTNTTLSSIDFSKGEQESPNPIKPNSSDFFIDVEHTIRNVLFNNHILTKFYETYILGNDTLGKQKTWIEQKIGKEFRKRNISPLGEYFKTMRR